MKKFLLSTFALLTFGAATTTAKSVNEATTPATTNEIILTKNSEKAQVKFGGWVEMRMMYNTYESFTPRGVINMFPYAPSYNSVGVNTRDNGSLDFSVFSSRFNFKVDNFSVLGADGQVFVEADFLGVNDVTLQSFRLRHAFIALQWEKDKLLMGQTGALLSNFDDLLANTVEFGAGIPFVPLNRGVQLRYERDFTPKVKLRVAAEMYGWHNSVGPSRAQANAAIPDLQTQMVFGDRTGKGFMAGFSGGVKFLKPRTTYGAGYKSSQLATSAFGGVFTKFWIGDIKVQAMSNFGGNMSPYEIWGGYGKEFYDDINSDYGYTNLITSTSWLDIETPKYCDKWQFGLFVGHQNNFGTYKVVDKSAVDSYHFMFEDLQWFMKVAPRVWFYPSSKFVFGFEYGYNCASWAKSTDNHLDATELYPTVANHRLQLLARYLF